jgi:hypothetical protein
MDYRMDHRDDARASELHNLRLALATFALQLDAFEMRMRMSGGSLTSGGSLKAGVRAEVPAAARDAGCRPQKG